MAKKKILLVCNAGMSTSLLVTKMQKAAEKDNVDVDIAATASADISNKINGENPNVMMLGPQVRYMQKDLAAKYDFPVEVINMQDYGMMNGENVLKAALKIIDQEDK
ncbi:MULTISPECIES: PTS sugar transporter subunit IIB [Lacticaseibacillus]|uniref:PTS sugar transporter subunit IIB n=1 Tax=Lacticaseibacillus TaxID=2759736 RepID=UPI00063DBDC1|nr:MULTISPECIES: PTS sugar transporter subunit IIB [Lacticaseibacillus]KLI75666.1 PTS sugar transporter [Lacticaseibacillus casei]